MNRFLVILFFSTTTFVFSQSSEKYNSEYANFYRAEELFQKQQYSAARKEFRNFLDGFKKPTDPMFIKALYYEGVSALELYNNDAIDLLEHFNREYPESIYKYDIYFRLGKFYYQKKDYTEALAWFSKLKASDLENEFVEEFYFKLGYANFQEGKMEEARNAFHEVKDAVSQYGSPSLYYYSHIAYKAGNYQTALEGFTKLEKDAQFGKVVPYYILQIYYLQGDYAKVTEYAPNLEGASIVNENDVNHLIGDAYYRIGKYDESVPFLEKYNANKKTTRDEDYQLGFAYYKSGDFTKAIKLLGRVANEKDSMGQVAVYQIGDCYMRTKDFTSARAAFMQASEISANPTIEEDALYQSAVLSYKLDLNPYNEAIIAFESYLQKYPNSPRKNDVYQYLVNVYTSTNNYGKALESLDKLPNKDIHLKKAYQLIAFNHGIELYQKTNYQDAIKTLALVDKYPIDATLVAKAKYWKADAYYELKDFHNAIDGYQAFQMVGATTADDLKNNSYYSMGYAQLYKGDTISAIESFRTYIQSNTTNKLKRADANMRIADAFYMRKENDAAIKHYGEALRENVAFQDQALYYKGMTHGIKNEANPKILALLDIINNYSKSKYVQSSVYHVALTYKSIAEYPNALRYYNQLIKDYPNAPDVKNAHLDIADIYLKQDQYANAEKEFLFVLENYGNESYFCEAVGSGLRNLYPEWKQPAKLEQIGNKYPCLGISQGDIEIVIFDPANKAYMDDKYYEAIPLLQEYLEKYPNGSYSGEALVYLGNSYHETDQIEKSIPAYEQALTKKDNSGSVLAAQRVAKYYYNSKNYQKALPYYKRVDQLSGDLEEQFNARLGIMRCEFLLTNYQEAIVYGKQVLASSTFVKDYRLESEYATGMSSYKTDLYADAIGHLEYVSKNTKTVIGAESKFTIAEIQFKQNDLDASAKTISELLKMKPGYDFWVAKGLILQAKISIQKDDLFQAEQTLKSVLDHYPKTDDGIKMEAGALYDELMQLKSSLKSDVVPEEAPVIELNEGGK